MKNWKLKYLFPVSFTFLLVPYAATVSCSQSMEKKLDNLLNDENIVNLKLNEESVRSFFNKNPNDPISIKDIFTANVANLITIEQSQALISWNENLSLEDKLAFSIKPKIKAVIFPSKANLVNNKLNYLEIVIDVSSGPYDNRTITKKLDLSNINNTIEFSVNNYFDWTNITNINNEGPIQNDLYKSLKINIKEYLNRKGITINNDDTNLDNQLSIKLTNDIDKFNLYQDNLYISFVSRQGNYIYLNVYSSTDKITNDKLTTNELYLKMSFTVQEINNKK